MATIEVNPSSFFECPVCMEDIDDSWKMIPACQHVFCLNCLRRIYEGTEENQNPKCPTCRTQIVVPLETLQKPRFLYEMYEHMRVSTNAPGGPTCTTDDLDGELIDAFEQQSIDDDLLQEQEEVIEDDDEYLLIGDLVAALELSILENSQQSPSNPSATANEASDHAGIVNSNNDVIVDEEPSAHDINTGDGTNANVPVCSFSLSNFNNYLTANGSEVLNTILTVVSDEEKLNSLELTEIFAYVKTIDLHLEALEIFRRQQTYKIIEEFGGEAGERILTRALALENRDDGDDNDANENTTSSDEEDIDFIADLLEALKQERKDDAILKVTLKKSKILDPIRTLQVQLEVIKKKLEHVLVNIVVELENRSQATADLHTSHPPIPQLPPTLIPQAIAPAPPPPRFESSPPSSTPIEQLFPAIRSLILSLASNSIRYSSPSSFITNFRGRRNVNLSSQRARTNTNKGSGRGNRGDILKSANLLSGNRGSSVSGSHSGSTKSCGSSAMGSRGGSSKTCGSSASGSRGGSTRSWGNSASGSRGGSSKSFGSSASSIFGGVSKSCGSSAFKSRGGSSKTYSSSSGSRGASSKSCGGSSGSRVGTSGSRAGSNGSRGSSIGSRVGFSGSRAGSSETRGSSIGSRAGSSGIRGSFIGSRAGSSGIRGSFSINLRSSISGCYGSSGGSGVRISGFFGHSVSYGSRGGRAGRASSGRR